MTRRLLAASPERFPSHYLYSTLAHLSICTESFAPGKIAALLPDTWAVEVHTALLSNVQPNLARPSKTSQNANALWHGDGISCSNMPCFRSLACSFQPFLPYQLNWPQMQPPFPPCFHVICCSDTVGPIRSSTHDRLAPISRCVRPGFIWILPEAASVALMR